jgi:hypothetical protein
LRHAPAIEQIKRVGTSEFAIDHDLKPEWLSGVSV